MPGLEITQGDSLALAYGFTDDTDLTGWDCDVQVKEALDATEKLLDLNFTELNGEKNRFVGLISKDTTVQWAPGDYFLLAYLSNDTTGQAKEFQADLRVMQQGVS